MENEIKNLIADLKSKETLNVIPCFYDRPDQIQFRIGFVDGPKIEFKQETADYYYLIVSDEDGRNYTYSIHKDIKQFEDCQEIFINLRTLCDSEEYPKYREKNIGIMITNLKNLIEPILSRISFK